ncbi:MAG TPA: PLD nuclease N-terminal domain-containing protein [Acidimicrobiales bacterium]|nr:PLD nuclease N-terminal domain-containing protein [Acidimicrobiales bacterium]
MPGRKKKRWEDRTAAERVGTVVLGTIEVLLAGMAVWDLTHRPASQVRGPKWRWGLVICVNIFGPLSYFRWGRVHPPELSETSAN